MQAPDLASPLKLLFILILCIPLAAWKLVEILIWIFKHITITW
jgi:hypothetical protein